MKILIKTPNNYQILHKQYYVISNTSKIEKEVIVK